MWCGVAVHVSDKHEGVCFYSCTVEGIFSGMTAHAENQGDRVAEYRVHRAREQSPECSNPILERCLDIIESIKAREFAGESGIRAAVRHLAPAKKEWQTTCKIKANERFFVALRTAAMHRGVRSRANDLRHDTEYIALCRALDRALKLRRRGDLDPIRRMGIATLSVRTLKELAGVLFVLPDIIQTSDLSLLTPKGKPDPVDDFDPDMPRPRSKETGVEDADTEQKRREIIEHLLWNEPVPILISKANQDTVQWHLAPEVPDDASRRDVRHDFLYGRRMVVSIPIDEALGGRVKAETLWAVIQDMARRVESERMSACKRWRAAKEATIRAERQKLTALTAGGKPTAACADPLLRAYDELLKHVDDYYSTRRGKARGKRDRGGVSDMLHRIGLIEEAFGTRNRGIRESFHLAGVREDGTSQGRDVPDRSADNAHDYSDSLKEVCVWLRENLPDYGLERGDADEVVKDLLKYRMRDGRMSGGRTTAPSRGKPAGSEQ